jgi:hypothetical protein
VFYQLGDTHTERDRDRDHRQAMQDAEACALGSWHYVGFGTYRAHAQHRTREKLGERVHFASMIHPGCTPRPAGLHTHAHGGQGITRDAVAIANASQTVRCMPIYLHPSTPAVGAYYACHVLKRREVTLYTSVNYDISREGLLMHQVRMHVLEVGSFCRSGLDNHQRWCLVLCTQLFFRRPSCSTAWMQMHHACTIAHVCT